MSPFLTTLGGGSARGFGRGFKVSIPLAPSAPPSSLSANAVSSSQISLSWTNGDASAQTELYQNGLLIATYSAGTNTASVSGLSQYTTYSYYVRHIKNSITSTNSNTVSNSTLPQAPSGLSVSSNSTTQLTLSWTNSNSLTTNIYYSNGAFIASVAADVNTYQHSGLTSNTSYSYYVNQTDGTLTSANSNTAGAYTYPKAPTSMAGVAYSTTSTSLSWGNTESLPIYLYRNGSFILQTNNQTYIDTGLSPSTTYSYYVVHYSTTSGLTSAASNTISVTTNAPVVGSQTYTTAGSYTFTVPATITQLRVTVVGGGGGGSGGSTGYAGNGGGAGGTVANRILTVSPGENVSVNVGTAGVRGTAANNTSTAGGGSFVNTNLGAYGGTRGLFQSNTAATGGGTITLLGTGGTTTNGNSGAVGSVASKGGDGGASTLASGGTGATFTLTGGNGSQGSGGGGGYGSFNLAQASNGGNGGAGYVKIEYGF